MSIKSGISIQHVSIHFEATLTKSSNNTEPFVGNVEPVCAKQFLLGS